MTILKRWVNSVRNFFVRRNGMRSNDSLAMNQVLQARNTPPVPTVAQLRHFPTLLSGQERKIAAAAVVLLVIAGTVLGVKLFDSARTEVPAVGGSYTEGLVGIPQLINPLYSMSSDVDSDLSRLIYSGLMRYDTEKGLVTDLAASYTISEDQKTYTFVLRDDARWHDGKPVTIDDVMFTISAIQNPDYRSPLAVSFSGVTVSQIDDQTISFVLNEPFAPFLSLLTTGILPSHLWQNVAPINAATATLNKKPIGSGPFQFEKLVKDTDGNVKSYTLVRNDHFYAGAPYLQELTFKFYASTTEAVDALRNRNIEGLAYLPASDVASFEGERDLSIIQPRLQQYTALFFNQSRNTTLASADVRTALAMATNKQALVDDALHGLGTAINSFILPGMIGEKTDLPVIAFDVAAATAKLDAAGWKLEEGATIRKNGEKTLTLELVTLDSGELVDIAEQIKAQWIAVGAEVNIKIVTSVELQSNILKNRSYDMLLSGELYGIDPDPYAFWHSSQANFPGLNVSMYSNRKADGYIETGRTTTDPAKRAEAYENLQTTVLADLPAIFLYQPIYSFVLPSHLNGVALSNIVVPADRFNAINTWYIKTKKTFTRKTEEAVIETTTEAETVDETVSP
ncbi:MAG: peptide ABC transporter substrate-binding protein [Patescibacteria group bacterium]